MSFLELIVGILYFLVKLPSFHLVIFKLYNKLHCFRQLIASNIDCINTAQIGLQIFFKHPIFGGLYFVCGVCPSSLSNFCNLLTSSFFFVISTQLAMLNPMRPMKAKIFFSKQGLMVIN